MNRPSCLRTASRALQHHSKRCNHNLRGPRHLPNPPPVPTIIPTSTFHTGEKPLPKLTPSEFRQYNRMAEHMDYYHNHFRHTWTTLMTACETNKRPAGMSIKQFLSLGEQFAAGLTMHHGIEERHIFPVLAKKMPAFRKELELLTQHKQIHAGLDRLEEYLGECRRGERELRLGEMKVVLEGFGEVLWRHLDDEVEQLGAENMRKYWTLKEMREIPI
jgi:hemerythrin-like domain-containing protein